VRGGGALVHEPVDDPQADRERHEPLLGTVVEVALEAPALGVAGHHHARPRGRELLVRLGVRERHGHELRERRDPVLVPRRERVRVHARDHHRAPQLPVEHDRRTDPGPDAELLQATGELARQPRVVVDALRLPAAVDLRRQRLPVEHEPRADGNTRDPRLVPPTDHIRGAVVAVADHVRRLRPEQATDLRGHGREHARRVAGARDERRDPPQGRLLVEQGLHRRAVGGIHRLGEPLIFGIPRRHEQ
jgi:hypothetical protein